MRYAALGPGKRVRPLVLLAACEAAGGVPEQALPVAAAIEMIHAFSLVHDDLPCMDDDDFRRGRPTCHKAFGEAVGLLAGDALSARALGYLAEQDRPWAPKAVAELADATCGMIAGQVLDMAAEGPEAAIVDIERLHALKTGRLFVAACRLGGIVAGAPDEVMAQLSTFGAQIGLAFQIADDILDAGDGEADAARGKATYPGRYGLEHARAMGREAVERALEAAKPLGPAAEPLRAIARFVIERDR